MRRAACVAVAFALTVTPAVAAKPVKTVGQFARLSHAARRQFAIRYMTTHGVDPCTNGRTPLSRAKAINIADAVAQLQPGRDPADGSYIPARTPIGTGIRHILANIGC